MTTVDPWAVPMLISDIELAFPANALDLMPPCAECEAALDAMPDRGRQWRAFQRTWFINGLPKTIKVYLADGVDGDAAFRHLGAIQGSYAPKHEHKEAAVAYLASRWFTKVEGLR